MDLFPLGPTGSKKRRIQVACDACLRRKCACDSEKMPGGFCSNCVELGIDCSAKIRSTEIPIADNSDPGLPFFQEYADVRSTATAILSPTTPFKVPTDHSTVRLTMVELARYISVLETELVSRTRQPVQDSLDRTDGPIPTDDVVLAEQIANLTLEHAKYRYFGPSSNFSFMNAVLDARRHFSGNAEVPLYPRRPQYWAVHPWQLRYEPVIPLSFPDPDLLDDLIELYFIHVNPYIPLFHRPTFSHLIDQKTHLFHHDFGLTVLTVCAVAARYCPTDSRVLELGVAEEDLTLSIGWKWFSQVLPHIFRMPSEPQPVSLYQFQLYCVATHYALGSNMPESAWSLIGLAVRHAHDIGIHRKISMKHRTVDTELWKRAFWVLVSMDIWFSVIIGRPRATNPEDYDQELPADCDDEYWQHADPARAFRQPPGKPSTLSFWLSFLKVLHILGLAHRSIYSVTTPEPWLKRPREWDSKIVVEIDSALNEWRNSIPDHLKWDPENPNLTFLNQSAILHIGYYYTQIISHQRFISIPGTNKHVAFPHLAICANAARSCCRLMELQSRRGYIPFLNTILPLFTSALVLLLNHWGGQRVGLPSNPGKEYADVRNCINVLRLYESTWQGAGRFCDILEQLINIEDETSPTTSNVLKRTASQSFSAKGMFDFSDMALWQGDADPGDLMEFIRYMDDPEGALDTSGGMKADNTEVLDAELLALLEHTGGYGSAELFKF
ncbi:fungal-specific transcription factor domain-containing protein [Mycena floridula]|nr:fungal-specific transcription factor domain-containing protein [Mycena floridula]